MTRYLVLTRDKGGYRCRPVETPMSLEEATARLRKLKADHPHQDFDMFVFAGTAVVDKTVNFVEAGETGTVMQFPPKAHPL